MKKNIKPLGDRVLVKITTKGDTTTKSGIILTDSSMRGQAVWGEVVNIGNGVYTQNGTIIPMTVKIGDLVMYKKDMVGDIIKIEDDDYLLFREHDLLMVKDK